MVQVFKYACDRRKKTGKYKNRDDKILNFDLVFLGWINTNFDF